MTANAMQGDKEECLASGMDDYLPKPVRPEALRAALERWGAAITSRIAPAVGDQIASSVDVASGSRSACDHTPLAVDHPPLDIDRFRELAGGDDRGMHELVTLYLRQTEEQLQRLRLAIEAELCSEVNKLAHSCAGASATCGMDRIVPPLRELERMGHSNNLTGARSQLESATSELKRIRQYFASHVTT
jgi:HPt (histidine-containing phosphotransfer) domain-containing protein